jgi:hypothetical protein
MIPRWLRDLRHREHSEDLLGPSEIAAFDELDDVLRQFAGDRPPFDESVGWAKVEARMRTAPRRSRLRSPFPNYAIPTLLSGAPRLAAGAVAAVALVAAITVLGLVLNGDGTARAEFYAAVDTIDELSNAALDDGLITPNEAAALNAQAAIIEQALAEDPDVVAISSEDATTNAIDVLTDVQARLSERSAELSAADAPTSNAVTVLQRVAQKLENAALEKTGQGQPSGDGRGRGEGNQGQGLGNSPDGSLQSDGSEGDDDGEQDGGSGPGRGSGRRP